ncbi:LppX_LprAFG lipoprotein [Nocardioides xinjiangensis]|uniref:LppX_LprAFG lipoprotein n=1 Tax=Nocardioides xinjiangensis TaxID=2817376 RepID=UPI001B30AFF5|nr:LppX_LprAFG lipoprotein [Nocardioides sp. SYSU D00514]
MPARGPARTRSRPARAAARLTTCAAAVALALPVLAACSGGGSGSGPGGDDGPTPEEVLTEASATLTETSGVELTLSTEALPDGVSGITRAVGTLTNAPAFEGSITVVFAGQNVDVPVVAVDDTVYAQLPFTPGWNEVDPREYGAPDPSGLIGDDGFAGLLTLTDSPEAGESVRGGADNSEILTTYTGTVPGNAMKSVIPSSTGESFDVEWQVSDEGELRRATLTGAFYPRADEMTYTVDFADYGTDKDITAP